MARHSKAARERMAANQLRNEVQAMVNRGEIDDPDFIRALQKVEQGVAVEDMGGDYFHPVAPKRKGDLASGKVFLVANERGHGMGTSPATYQAMLAAEQLARSGRKDTTFAGPAKDLEKIAAFLDQNVMQGSISDVGTLGSREMPTDREKLLRAAALFGDVDRGYDPKHGMPFNTMNSSGTVPLDAGHFLSHVSNPELSNAPTNIGYQNQYENKGQAAAEKIAGQLGRDATPTELADMLYRSIINRTVDDVKLPFRKGSKAHAEFMAPINAKVR
jgi:hypothetical protein